MSGCFLQAARTILKILLQPTCLQAVKAIFPQLSVALFFQVSVTMELMLQEVHLFGREHQQDPPAPIRCCIPILPSLPETWSQGWGSWRDLVSLCRSMVQSMKALLCSVGFESQVLAIETQGG